MPLSFVSRTDFFFFLMHTCGVPGVNPGVFIRFVVIRLLLSSDATVDVITSVTITFWSCDEQDVTGGPVVI